jgi:hypothetical protein
MRGMIDLPELKAQGTERNEPSAHRQRLGSALTGGALYLVLSIFLWWNVWSNHPTSTAACGCGDSAKFTWFFGWVAHAIAHGQDPFYSTYLYHPHGVNLLADTSSTAVGIVLTPITWTFGPIATLNVALTLSPVLSALSMFVLLRRWTRWAPAAFVGGLLYGFSPFVIVSLTSGWVDFTLLTIPPLCALALDELLIRQRWRPLATGIGLGLLIVVQFFVGTEVLLMTVGFAAFGVLILVIFATLRRRELLRTSARHASIGIAASAVTSVALLAYPAWFALWGPASFSGRVWGGYFEGDSAILRYFVLPQKAYVSATGPVGYQGLNISTQYIGVPCLIVVLVGLIVWRHDLRLWLFTGLAVVSALVAYLHPLSGLPLVQNVIPYRYVLVTYFAIAVLLCLIVEHTRDAVRNWQGDSQHRVKQALAGSHPSALWMPTATALAVAVVALLPMVLTVGQTSPFTAQPIVLPDWFQTVAPHLDPTEVLLVLPVQYISGESPQAWQSVGGFTFQMAEQGGPAEVYTGSGPYRTGATALGIASTGIPSFNHFTMADVAATRVILNAWGVTTIVIPDQPGLPVYDRVASVPLAAALVTAATGRLPIRQADAWVWKGVNQPATSTLPPTLSLADCIARSDRELPGTVERVVRCVHGQHS